MSECFFSLLPARCLFLPDFGENNCFNGYFLTVATGISPLPKPNPGKTGKPGQAS
jgi:hypothetical protein